MYLTVTPTKPDSNSFNHKTTLTFPAHPTQNPPKTPKIPSSSICREQQQQQQRVEQGSPKERDKQEKSGSNGGNDLGKDGRPILNIKWGDLLNPDPDNLLAIALTGLLTWASVQVLWQLFFISLAILLAALKYSFVAALLIFILITLL